MEADVITPRFQGRREDVCARYAGFSEVIEILTGRLRHGAISGELERYPLGPPEDRTITDFPVVYPGLPRLRLFR